MPELSKFVPILHVANVPHSVAFYESLGFEATQVMTTRELGENPHWARMKCGAGEVMLALATAPIDPAQQAVLLYLYVQDVGAYRDELAAKGVSVGRLERPHHSPAGEFRVTDPDGYGILVGEG